MGPAIACELEVLDCTVEKNQRDDCEKKRTSTYSRVCRFGSLLRNGTKWSDKKALGVLSSIKKLVLSSQKSRQVSRVTLPMVLKIELPIGEVEMSFISLSEFSSQYISWSLMVTSEKIRGLI